MEDILKLFKLRDNAVKKKDFKTFLLTQVDEIEEASSEGYFSLDGMETTVVATAKAGGSAIAAFVQEGYSRQNRPEHSAFLIYYLVNTRDGWKIYKISH